MSKSFSQEVFLGILNLFLIWIILLKVKTGFGAEELAKLWDTVREFAGYCDDAGVEDALEELKGYRLPEEEKPRLQSVQKALDEFDFDAVLAAMNETSAD